jgi:hypothetical protein
MKGGEDMGNAVLDTNETISGAEEKNWENIDGSNVLSLQNTVAKREKTRAERKVDFDREMEEIRKGIKEHQIAEFGRVLTRTEMDAILEEEKEERRKRYEGLTIEEIAQLMDEDTAETMLKIRAKFGANFIKTVNDGKPFDPN